MSKLDRQGRETESRRSHPRPTEGAPAAPVPAGAAHAPAAPHLTAVAGDADRHPRKPARQVLLVLGMHRSGTSALTGTLIRLGAGTPQNLMDAHPSNERGFYESNTFVKLHDKLLSANGSRWDDWRRLPEEWFSSFAAERFRAEAKLALLEEFGEASVVALKDPRICRFVPFWAGVLEDMRVPLRAVIPVRAPIEVARSLAARDGFSIEKGLLLWLRHVLDAERGTRGWTRSVTTMDAFLDDWRGTAGRIARELDIAWPRSEDEAAEEIDAFLSKDLRHHVAPEEEISSLHAWAREAYRAMVALAADPRSREAQAVLDRIAAEFEPACEIFADLVKDATSRVDASAKELTAARQEAAAAQKTAQDAQGLVEAETAKRRSAEQEAERLRAGAADTARRLDEQREAVARRDEDVRRLGEELAKERLRSAGDEARLSLLDRLMAESTDRLAEVHRQIALERGRAEDLARQLTARDAAQEMLRSAVAEERARRQEAEARALALLEEKARLELKLGASVARQEALGRDLAAAEARQEALDRDLAAAVEQAELTAKRLVQEGARADEAEELARQRQTEIEKQAKTAVERQAEIDKLAQLETERQAEIDKLVQRAAQAERQAAQMAQDVDGLRRQLQTASAGRTLLARRIEDEVAARDEAAARLFETRTRNLELAQRVAAEEGRAALAEHALHALSTETERLQATKRCLDGEIAALRASPYWRLTRPLRGTVRIFSRMRRRLAHGRPNPLFDETWYLEQYQDVRATGWDPFAHYIRYGAAEGRKPNPLFDSHWYLDQNPDVRASGMNPLLHFWKHGAAEGRNPGPDFDTSWYLARNEDVKASDVNPLLHFLRHGVDEGRSPKAAVQQTD